MIDLHTHTVFSDGALIPAELVRRARVKGYEAIARVLQDVPGAASPYTFQPTSAALFGRIKN